MKKFAIAYVFLVLTVFASCKTGQATMPGEILTTNTWQLSQLNGNMISADTYSRGLPYVTFTSDNKIAGNSGCNGFSGSYNLNDTGGMNISRIVATKMFCDGVNEADLFDALNKVTMTKVENDKLTLMNGVEEILVFVPKK